MYFYHGIKIHTYTKLNIKLCRKFIVSPTEPNINIENTSSVFCLSQREGFLNPSVKTCGFAASLVKEGYIKNQPADGEQADFLFRKEKRGKL